MGALAGFVWRLQRRRNTPEISSNPERVALNETTCQRIIVENLTFDTVRFFS